MDFSNGKKNGVTLWHCFMGHFSSKKKEGDEGLNLNTVECLRGRLLAERQASRVAKEEVELMGNKVFFSLIYYQLQC